jgi:MFS family permease
VSRTAQIRVFTVLAIAALCGGLVVNATTIALPKVFAERLADLTGSTVGVGSLVSLVCSVAAMAQLLVGAWLDRYAFKWILLAVTAVQVPLLVAAAQAQHLSLLLLAFPLMFCIFGAIPINDWIVAHYATAQWRSRVYALKYVLALGVSAFAVPLVAWLHRTNDGFQNLFLGLAACAAVILVVAASVLPGGHVPARWQRRQTASPVGITAGNMP